MPTKPTVFVVDDDADIRRSLQCLLETVGLPVRVFASAEHFLESYRVPQPGCLLLDVRMPGMGGIRLLDRVQKFEAHLPVIVLTGHGDVPMAVQAMKSGAFDFIEKPANFQQLLHRVQEALERVEDGLATDRVRRAQESEQANFQRLLRLLSPRERQVLDRLVDGASGKMIASELGISERTVEKHREHAMHKLGARSLAELIAMATSHITQT